MRARWSGERPRTNQPSRPGFCARVRPSLDPARLVRIRPTTGQSSSRTLRQAVRRASTSDARASLELSATMLVLCPGRQSVEARPRRRSGGSGEPCIVVILDRERLPTGPSSALDSASERARSPPSTCARRPVGDHADELAHRDRHDLDTVTGCHIAGSPRGGRARVHEATVTPCACQPGAMRVQMIRRRGVTLRLRAERIEYANQCSRP